VDDPDRVGEVRALGVDETTKLSATAAQGAVWVTTSPLR
jgi:hypothetical protein